MTIKDTALSSWALLIWQALQNDGQNAKAIFERAGLDPQVLSDGSARYEADAMQRLWYEVHQQVNSPAFGIAVGNLWSPHSFHALGYSWLASRSLGDAMQRFCRYAKVVNTRLESRLSRHGLDYSFSFSSRGDWALNLPWVYDAAFTALFKMCRLLLGGNFSLLEARLEVSSAASRTLLEAALGCPVVYGCEGNEIIVARDDIERELLGTSPELLQVNENLLQDYLIRLGSADMTQQVERAVLELMPAGEATETRVASLFNMSGRSLQRRLSAEETNFSHILQYTREKMATHYLRGNQLSLSEIAYLLGFSEQANFSRAFKRWHQCSPGEYRRSLHKVSA